MMVLSKRWCKMVKMKMKIKMKMKMNIEMKMKLKPGVRDRHLI